MYVEVQQSISKRKAQFSTSRKHRRNASASADSSAPSLKRVAQGKRPASKSQKHFPSPVITPRSCAQPLPNSCSRFNSHQLQVSKSKFQSLQHHRLRFGDSFLFPPSSVSTPDDASPQEVENVRHAPNDTLAVAESSNTSLVCQPDAVAHDAEPPFCKSRPTRQQAARSSSC